MFIQIGVDAASKKYAEDWKARRAEGEDAIAFRIDSAREALEQTIRSLETPEATVQVDAAGDTIMQDGEPHANGAIASVDAEVATITIEPEDELSNVPPEHKEKVAADIKAFRERSNKRDLERLRMEEEIEAQEKARAASGRKDTLSAGHGSSANGIPLGPRADRAIQGAPTAPKGMQMKQEGNADGRANGTAFVRPFTDSENDSDASDGEIWRRREAKEKEVEERKFRDYERSWLSRERTRTAALKRQEEQEKRQKEEHERRKKEMWERFMTFDTEKEKELKRLPFYADRAAWSRQRKAFREKEERYDAADREAEARELRMEQEKKDRAGREADSFLDGMEKEAEARHEMVSMPFKISLGAAAQQKKQAAKTTRRTAAEVEGLLDNEEEEHKEQKQRAFIPLKFDSAADTANLTDEERKQAVRQLAADIPMEIEQLSKWNIQWDLVDEHIMNTQLIPFVEKKIVDAVGVQEEMLVDAIRDHIESKGKPEDLVETLEGPLDREVAEPLVRKLWRMIVFFTESERRGLGAV
jgi:hypothetical protein